LLLLNELIIKERQRLVGIPLVQCINAFEEDRFANNPDYKKFSRTPIKKYGVINLLVQPKPEEIVISLYYIFCKNVGNC